MRSDGGQQFRLPVRHVQNAKESVDRELNLDLDQTVMSYDVTSLFT